MKQVSCFLFKPQIKVKWLQVVNNFLNCTDKNRAQKTNFFLCKKTQSLENCFQMLQIVPGLVTDSGTLAWTRSMIS